MHTTVITSDAPVEVHVGERGGYWFKVWVSVIESGAWARLGPTAAKVYVTLARYANGNPSLACWPSSSTLERDSGLSRSAVFRALAELVSAGLVVRRLCGGGTTTTTFQLVEPRGSESAASRPAPMAPAPPPAPTPPTRPTSGTGTRPGVGTPPVAGMGRDLDPGIKNNSSSGCGSSMPNRSPIGTASVTTPAPASQAPESQDQGPIGLLIAEGFSRGDAGRLAEFGSDRVRKALANCDSLERRGKLRSGRRSYIARAIQDDYTLSEAAERDLWPQAAQVLKAKLEAVCSEDDAQQLAALYKTPLGAIQARAVSVEDVHAMTPGELLHRLINRGRPR